MYSTIVNAIKEEVTRIDPSTPFVLGRYEDYNETLSMGSSVFLTPIGIDVNAGFDFPSVFNYNVKLAHVQIQSELVNLEEIYKLQWQSEAYLINMLYLLNDTYVIENASFTSVLRTSSAVYTGWEVEFTTSLTITRDCCNYPVNLPENI